MNAEQIKQIVDAAVSAALQGQRAIIDSENKALKDQISELTRKICVMQTPSSSVETYEEIKITSSIGTDNLDAVKSLPEFNGTREKYVSWRAAAKAAHKIHENTVGTARYYQAVLIIRNKIVGNANDVLASFNTVLNFKAIIARLDFTYADKRPIYLIEQELSTLRQGELSISEFYSEVEKRVAMLVNKTTMTYGENTQLTINLNTKYRQDGLRIFISGLKKPLCDILFSSRPEDMATALALAQEVEANHQRYVFANSFAKRNEMKDSKSQPYRLSSKTQGTVNNQQKSEPMDIDPSSSKFRYSQSSNSQAPYVTPKPDSSNKVLYGGDESRNINNLPPKAEKRYLDSGRFSNGNVQKWQRLNHIEETRSNNETCDRNNEVFADENRQLDEDTYEVLACEADEDIEELNFLGKGPCFLGSQG